LVLHNYTMYNLPHLFFTFNLFACRQMLLYSVLSKYLYIPWDELVCARREYCKFDVTLRFASNGRLKQHVAGKLSRVFCRVP
jgi:hypothetical protein